MGSLTESSKGEIVEITIPAPLPTSKMPISSSGTIQVVPATPLERYQCWQINSHSWRGPFSIEQYLEREAVLERQALTRDGKITYWILTDISLPVGLDGARQILASCETLQKVGYLAKDGHIQELVTHGIGSVFCRHEYRGQGYASRMMTEIGERLKTWQQERGSGARFSMLWSDIGSSFYAKHGWKAMRSTHLTLPAVSRQSSFQLHNCLSSICVQDLSAEHLQKRVCSKAIEILEAKLRAQSEETPDIRYIAVRPDFDHMAWHHAREDFQAKILYNKDPNVKGAEDPATGCALIWARVFGATPQKNKLHILHAVVPTDVTGDNTRSFAALLLRAQLEATMWGMDGGVEIWSPVAHIIEAAQYLAGDEKVQMAVRDKESVCSLRWIGGQDEKVEWVAKEKYAWC